MRSTVCLTFYPLKGLVRMSTEELQNIKNIALNAPKDRATGGFESIDARLRITFNTN